jgi:hypothetical protein
LKSKHNFNSTKSNNYGRELLSHEYVNVTVLPAVMVAVVGFMIKLVLDMLV